MFGGMPAAAEIFQQHTETGNTLLELQGVSALGDRGEVAIRNLSLQLRAGEIFGIAGVDGNGQKELGEIIAGQRKTTTGRLIFDGTDYTNKGVATLSRAGVGYITDDRMGEGVVPGMSVAQNAALNERPLTLFERVLARSQSDGGPSNKLIEHSGQNAGCRNTDHAAFRGNIKADARRELAMNRA